MPRIGLDINGNKCRQTSRAAIKTTIQTCCNVKTSRSGCNLWLVTLLCPGWMEIQCMAPRYCPDCIHRFDATFPFVSLYSYGKIYSRLRHHQFQSQPQAHQRQPPNEGETQMNIARYKKTVFSIAWVQLAILACYLPFIVVGMLFTYGKLTGGLSSISYFFVAISILYFNSSLNPILYCWKILEVRQAVKDIVGQLNCCKSNQT